MNETEMEEDEKFINQIKFEKPENPEKYPKNLESVLYRYHFAFIQTWNSSQKGMIRWLSRV